MMYEWIVTVLFRCINFSIIVWLCGYFMLHYVLPRIAKKKQQQIDARAALHQSHNGLMHKKNIEQAAMEHDQKVCAVLKRKVLVWKTRVVQEHIDREQEECAWQERVQERLAMQAQARAHIRVMHTVIPKAFLRARTTLQERYKDDLIGKKYVHNVLHMLKERL